MIIKVLICRYSECKQWANAVDTEFTSVKTSTTETDANGVIMFGTLLSNYLNKLLNNYLSKLLSNWWLSSEWLSNYLLSKLLSKVLSNLSLS